MSTLNRMKVLGIIGFIYGTLSLLADIFILNVSIWTYFVDAIVMIFTVFLLVQRSRIFNGTMNAFVIERDFGLKSKKVDKKEVEVEIPKKKAVKKTTTKKTTTTKKAATKTTAKKTTTKKATTKKTTKKAK
jgi:hypothetical protein